MATPTPSSSTATTELVMRRAYTDSGELIREGKVPATVPNERTALLSWWAEQDQQQAEAAAQAAQTEAEALAAMDQQPTNGDAMAIPALQQRMDQVEVVLNQHADLLGTLEASQPDEVLRLATQVRLGAGAAEALEAKALEVQAQISATAATAQQRLDALEQQQSASISEVAGVVVGARQQIELAAAQALADCKRQTADLITTTRALAAEMVGPRGSTGAAGISTVVGSGAPTDANTLMPLIDRGAIKGDVYIDAADDARRAYRWDGSGTWEPGPAFVSTVTRDVKISSLDASTKVTSLQTVSGGGGGGGGGEHLLVNRIGVRTAIAVADSSNWAGVSDVTSGQIVAELTALDGGLVGRTYFVLIPFTVDSFTNEFTVDGELGGLKGLYDINISVQRSPAVAPAVFTGAMPPGSNRTVVFLSVVPSAGGGGDTTSFRLGGDIEWAHIAQGAAVSLQSGGLQPLWIWS